MKRTSIMRSGIRRGITLAALATLCWACSEDEVVNSIQKGISFGATTTSSEQTATRALPSTNYFVLRGENPNDTLCVSATVTPGMPGDNGAEAETRGALATSVPAFSVSAYYYPSTTATAPSTFYMYNEAVGSNGTTTNNTYYWPNEGNMSFLAVAPLSEVGTNLTIPTREQYATSPITLSYTVPGTVADQQDVMVATAGMDSRINNKADGAAVDLNFKHLLTAVRFAFADDIAVTGKITNITLSGIQGGTVTYTQGTDGTWAVSSISQTGLSYSQTFDKSSTDTDKSITNDNSTVFLLAPQTLGTDAKVTVTFQEEGVTDARTLTANLTGTWPMGQTVTYKLSITPSYHLQFETFEEVLDAHYIITQITFTTDVDWTLSVPDAAKDWAYLSKEKSNTGGGSSTSGNLENEITSGQKAGKWSYVQKCNKQSISGTVTSSGTEETVTVYMLLRENASDVDRTVTLNLSKTGETAGGKSQLFTQLGYMIIDGFAMERIEDAESPFGFASNVGEVTYKYTAEGGFWPWLISCYLSGGTSNSFYGITLPFYYPTGPKDITINLNTDVTSITDANNGLTNTTNASSLTASADENWLIEQGWYTAQGNTDITVEDTRAAVQYCLSKNSYGDFTGNNDDTNASDYAEVVWYLPAVNEMLKITEQETDSRATQYATTNPSYWTSTAINSDALQAYSWYFGATAGQATSRETTLKVRAARVLNE